MKVVGEKYDAVTARPESYVPVWILGWSQLLLDHTTEVGYTIDTFPRKSGCDDPEVAGCWGGSQPTPTAGRVVERALREV